MKRFDLQQNSPEWFEARLGFPTSSCFGKIVTPAKGDFSTQSDKYAHVLISEIMTKTSQKTFGDNYWVERGRLLEAQAVTAYELETGFDTIPGGFVTNDSVTYGASPDRLVLDNGKNIIGGVEIKCPAPWTHIGNMLEDSIGNEYKPQVQGQLCVCDEIEFIDTYSYSDEMPSTLIRTKRDEDYIEKLADGLEKFNAFMDECLAGFIAKGWLDIKPNKAEFLRKYEV